MAPAATEYEPPSTSTSDVTIIIQPVRAFNNGPPTPRPSSTLFHPSTHSRWSSCIACSSIVGGLCEPVPEAATDGMIGVLQATVRQWERLLARRGSE